MLAALALLIPGRGAPVRFADRIGKPAWTCISCRGGVRGEDDGPAPACPCGGLVRPRVTL
jgi:hypothetical protein